MADDLDPSPVLDEIERLAARRHARLHVVPRRRLEAEARTDAPQGVLARAGGADRVRSRRPVPDASAASAPFLVVFDGVTDPHNLGSLLRSAECAGVTGVVVPRHRAAHVTPDGDQGGGRRRRTSGHGRGPRRSQRSPAMTQAGVTTVGLDADGRRLAVRSGRGRGGGAIDMTGPAGSRHRSRRQGSGSAHPAAVRGVGIHTAARVHRVSERRRRRRRGLLRAGPGPTGRRRRHRRPAGHAGRRRDVESRWWESNPRPDDYKSPALPLRHTGVAVHATAAPGDRTRLRGGRCVAGGTGWWGPAGGILASRLAHWQAGRTMALNDRGHSRFSTSSSRGGPDRKRKAAAIRTRIGISPTQYYRQLGELVDSGPCTRALPPPRPSSATSPPRAPTGPLRGGAEQQHPRR
jgi:hypothetical protein